MVTTATRLVAAELRMADRLLADGGLLCGDDLESQASPAECTAVNLAVHYMKDPVTGIHYHPGVTRAVAEAFGLVSTYQGFFVMRKMHSSYRQVDLIGKTATIPRHFPADLKTALRKRCGKGAGD